MPTILNASCGQSMMGYCWWAHGPSFQKTACGVLCWPASTSTFTGATMMQPTARHIRWCLGTARSRPRHFVGRGGSVQSGQKRASRPRRRSRSSSRHHSQTPAQGGWSGHSNSSPPNRPLSCHRGEPSSSMSTPCPNWPQLSTSCPMPGPATPVGEWPGPPSMRRMPGRMTSKPCICLSTT